MMRKYLFFLLFLFLASCHTVYQPATVAYAEYQIKPSQKPDSHLQKLINPYQQKMTASMSKVIGHSAQFLKKSNDPESLLGNFMADCFKTMAEKNLGITVDLAFMNKHGIRTDLPAGAITIGNVFELMPFDNILIVQELPGKILREFFNNTAADNGWPVSSGVFYEVRNKLAVNIRINGKPLNDSSTYTVANSDYVANGGSGGAMLKKFQQKTKGYLIRDALIDYIAEQHNLGKKINPQLEKRVVSYE